MDAKEVESADDRCGENRQRNGRAELKECGHPNGSRMVDEVAKRAARGAEGDGRRRAAGQNRPEDEAAGKQCEEHHARHWERWSSMTQAVWSPCIVAHD